ncbi:hypothetical protein CDD83_6573 [Cordyceps sp. RAO-2017]|nr:hypothetical protein CDD83_6573 [Cordyceps sp. RAO-2017]
MLLLFRSQLAPRRSSKPCRAVLRRTLNATFCVSTPDGLRQRPAAVRRAPRPAQQPSHRHEEVGLPARPVPRRPVSEPVPEAATTTTTTTRPRDAVEAVAADRQSLASYKVIRQGPGAALTATATGTKHEARRLAAAESFFRHRCDFLYSASTFRQHALNEHTPEVVVMGASNVGKSSFLNALLDRPGAARVGQRPGLTRLMNAFGVGPPPHVPRELVRKGSPPPRHSLVLVDTPGYGHKSQASWGDAVVAYLERRRMLRGAVVLLSSDKGRPLDEDRWLLRTLAELDTRLLVVLTKADKCRGRDGWPRRCGDMAEAVLDDLRRIDGCVGRGGGKRMVSSSSSSSSSSSPQHIYITSAGMSTPGRLGNGGGMGGVRAAILEMAGFTVRRDAVAPSADKATYAGPVVAFDDIQWKANGA